VITTSADYALALGLMALCAFSFPLVVSFCIDSSFTDGEVCFDFVFSGNRSGHPRVGIDLLNSGSLGWVQSHHLLEKVFELGSVNIFSTFCLSMRLPEMLSSPRCNQTIVWVLGVRRSERWPLSQDYEKDDSRCEKIDAGAFIFFAQMDFRSHVASCSKLGLQQAGAISAGSWRGKSQV